MKERVQGLASRAAYPTGGGGCVGWGRGGVGRDVLERPYTAGGGGVTPSGPPSPPPSNVWG